MSMETLNVIQLIQLLVAYIGYTTGLPALVFYRKVKRFPAAVRFLIYFTIGNFYIINLVQVLELLHISYRFTLALFTFVPAVFCIVKLYRLPVRSYLKQVLTDGSHYVLREMGLKTFMIRRWQECKVFLRMVARNLGRLLKENALDIPFFIIFVLLMWKICGPGILHKWGYGASDLPVHNYWINGLIENQIYIAGIYPMGMHCMLYYLATMLDIPVYVTLRLFWLVQYSTIALVLLAFLKGTSTTRFVPYLGVLLFVGAKQFSSVSYLRYGATLPQEFGMMYILPSIFFVMQFFKAKQEELRAGIGGLRCTSNWYLLGFAMSFSLTLSSHFYDTIIAGILCIGIVLGYGYWFWKKAYFCPIMLSGIGSILMAFLPMAAAFLTGKGLQGSMYWAMSIIGLRDYTVLIFRIICIGVVAVTAVGIWFVVRGVKKGSISLEAKRIEGMQATSGDFWLALVTGVLPLAAVVLTGMKYQKTVLWGFHSLVFTVPDQTWILYGMGATLAVGLIQRCLREPMGGAALLSMTAAEILLLLVLVSGSIGWPTLMEPARVTIYAAYLLPVVVCMAMDGAASLVLPRRPQIQQMVGLVLTVLLLLYGGQYDWVREPFGGGNLEMNEAILCTTNILREEEGQQNKWTIVSANDELRMIEQYGRHTETIDFLWDMEHWNPSKEVTIPTDRVYFYIEKQPLNYNNGYGGTIPVVSEEEAAKPLPQSSGINAYTGPNRAITMSKLYYWAQQFRALYPNEMKVYYENERFVCYYIEQNVFRLYNFAIDYGYN